MVRGDVKNTTLCHDIVIIVIFPRWQRRPAVKLSVEGAPADGVARRRSVAAVGGQWHANVRRLHRTICLFLELITNSARLTAEPFNTSPAEWITPLPAPRGGPARPIGRESCTRTTCAVLLYCTTSSWSSWPIDVFSSVWTAAGAWVDAYYSLEFQRQKLNSVTPSFCRLNDNTKNFVTVQRPGRV